MERDLSLDRCQGDCVIYARYSSHNQRDVSIEQQVADCEAYARSLGLRVVKVYADRALSGMTDKRPQFQTMLRDAAHRRWAYLIVWKIDRFARNRYDSATYKFRLKRCGVRVLYAKESIPDGPEGILLESVLEGSAEYYSANLSQNIRRGMRYNAMNCKVNSGSIPFGYRKGEDGRFAVDPGEAEVVREIFRKVADGIPFVEISNDLNGRGIRTKRGGLWGRNSFHRLLTNETYVGVYRFGDVRVEDGVPPVIDRALFLAVDERLKNKKNPQGRHRENGEYMLTGKLFCGLCGAPMVGVSGTARSGALHHYYVCQKRRTERSCSKANVGRDWLERVVVQATLDYVLKPEVIEWMADAVMAYQEREANSAVLLGLRDQLSENQRATANLMKAIEAGIITLTTKGRLVELEAEASRLRDAITLEEAAQTHIERDFMVYWFEKFRGGDLEDAAFRRRVIDSFVNAVYLWDDRLRVAFNYSGKGSAVDMELVMDAEALAGPEGRFVLAPPASTKRNGHDVSSCPFLLAVELFLNPPSSQNSGPGCHTRDRCCLKLILHVEAEVDHVAVLHHILLAFAAELALLLGGVDTAVLDHIIIGNDLRPDEAPLDVSVDFTGGLRGLGALFDGPGAALILAVGQERDKAQQGVAALDEPIQTGFCDAQLVQEHLPVLALQLSDVLLQLGTDGQHLAALGFCQRTDLLQILVALLIGKAVLVHVGGVDDGLQG